MAFKSNWKLSFKGPLDVVVSTVALALCLGIFVSVDAGDTLPKSLDPDNSQVSAKVVLRCKRAQCHCFPRLTSMITTLTGTVLKKRDGAVYIRLGVNETLRKMWTLKRWTKGRGSSFR